MLAVVIDPSSRSLQLPLSGTGDRSRNCPMDSSDYDDINNEGSVPDGWRLGTEEEALGRLYSQQPRWGLGHRAVSHEKEAGFTPDGSPALRPEGESRICAGDQRVENQLK